MPDAFSRAFGEGEHVYCVGCISLDACMVFPVGTAKCAVCGGRLTSEEEFRALRAQWDKEIVAQLPTIKEKEST